MKTAELKILDEITHKYLLPSNFKKFKKTFDPPPKKITNGHSCVKKRTVSRAGSIKYSKTYADNLINFINNNIQKPRRPRLFSSLGEAFNIAGFNDAALKLLFEIIPNIENRYTSVYINSLLIIGKIYAEKGFWKKSNSFVKQTLRIFSKRKDLKGLIKCYNILGCNFAENNNFMEAIINFKKCLTILNEKDDVLLRAKIEMNLGAIYSVQYNLELSLYFSQLALFKFEKYNDLNNITMLRFNIAINYYEMNKFNLALKEFDKCILLSQRNGFFKYMGHVYYYKAMILIKIGDIKMAIAYWRESLKIFESVNDLKLKHRLLRLKGLIEQKRKKYNISEKYFIEIRTQTMKYGNKLLIAENELELGYLYKEWGQTDKALASFTNAVKIYKRINIRYMSEKAEAEINNLQSAN